MSKKRIKRIVRILFIAASISSLYFVPWILVKAWILPLPDTIQEQLEEGSKVELRFTLNPRPRLTIYPVGCNPLRG